MANLAQILIPFAKVLNILGILPLKLEKHEGILLLSQSSKGLNNLMRFRIFFCCSHCLYLLFRTGQYVVDKDSFSTLDGTVLICFCMSYIFVLVLLINTYFHTDDLCTFWNQIVKFYNLSQSHRDDGHHDGEVCRRIKAKFVWGLSIAFGLAGALFCAASALIFVNRPTHPIYISSMFLSCRLEDRSKTVLLLLAIYDLKHNVENWCTIIFYVHLIFDYFSIMASWLAELK